MGPSSRGRGGGHRRDSRLSGRLRAPLRLLPGGEHRGPTTPASSGRPKPMPSTSPGRPGPIAYFLNLKLNDPAAASAFANRYNANASPTAPFLSSWQSIRDGDAQVLAKVRLVLLTGSWLLALLALASVVVLVGGRMAEQTRRVGPVEGRRGHAAVRCRRAALRARTGRPVRRRRRAARRMAGGAVDRRAGCGSPRCAERPVAQRHHRRLGGRAGARGGDRVDVRARHSCRASEHGRGARRLGPAAAAQCSGDQTLGALAGTAAPRRPTCGSPTTATAPQRVQLRRHHERSRRCADPPCADVKGTWFSRSRR